MPPINAKVEAERLHKAKLAILKMKNRKQKLRSSGKVGAKAQGSQPNVKVPQFSGDVLPQVLDSRKGKVQTVSKVSESSTDIGTCKYESVTASIAEDTYTSRKSASSGEERTRDLSVTNGHSGHGKPRMKFTSGTMKAAHNGGTTSLLEIPKKRKKVPLAPAVLGPHQNIGKELSLFETTPDKVPKNKVIESRKSMGLGDWSPYIRPSAVTKVYVNRRGMSSTSKAGAMSDLHQVKNGGSDLLNPFSRNQVKTVSFDLDGLENVSNVDSSHSGERAKSVSLILDATTSDEKQVERSSDFIPRETSKQAKTCGENGVEASSSNSSVLKHLPHKRKKLKEKKLKVLKLIEHQSVHLGNESYIKPPQSPIIKKLKSKKLKILEKIDSPVYSSSDSPARNLKKVSKLLALGLKKSRIANKKTCAPMSIKMTSGSGKGPLFVVTENESMKGERLSMKLPKMKHANLKSDSAFIVTTVPEKMLSANEEEDSESSTSEDDESSDLQQDAEEMQGSSSENEANEVLTDHAGTSTATKGSRDGVEDSLNDGSKVQFYFVDDQLVLHLKHPTTFTFCGHVQIEVLKGAVEALGFLVTPSSGSHSILSPLNKPLMTLQTVALDKCASPSLNSWSHDIADLIQTGNPHDSFILMRKDDNTMLSFLEQYMKKDFLPRPMAPKTKDLGKMADNYLQCLCMPPSRKFKAFQKGNLWDEVFTNTSRELGCTLLSGGKGVGKSTILRHFVNRYLSGGVESVVVIDFDPGQSELTVPGCVSLTVVKKPLLGPNFYNQQDPLKCIYIGEVNLVDCVSRYFNACSAIINYWRFEEQFRKMPCLVNTMGFTQGLGVTLMVQILSVLQPTSVIQIQSSSAALNYPDLLSVEYVKKSFSNSPFRLQSCAQSCQLSFPSSLKYDLHVINSVVGGGSDLRKINPAARFNRDTAVLSYISKIVHPPYTSLLQVVPYCCPLDSLYLHVSHESVSSSVILSTFNASIVGLCCIEPEKEDITAAAEPGLPCIVKGQLLADCLGFGIVRGIDMDSRKLYLLTPVAPNVMSSVNCLVLGAICLPSGVFLSPPKVMGFVPYVVSKQKSFLPTYFERS